MFNILVILPDPRDRDFEVPCKFVAASPASRVAACGPWGGWLPVHPTDVLLRLSVLEVLEDHTA